MWATDKMWKYTAITAFMVNKSTCTDLDKNQHPTDSKPFSLLARV